MAAQASEDWPPLPYTEWKETCATLHMWTQVIGKIRLTLAPWVNHSWHVTLYLSARGLTTSPIPYGHRIFEISFDFIDHQLIIATAEGQLKQIPLASRTVADFYRGVMATMNELGLAVRINTVPNELPDPIPFEKDETHRTYDPAQANRFWLVLAQSDRVFKQFRAGFCGKCSPVHFFWGSFDLAVTRFSGRTAPPHPGGVPHLPDSVAREAYSQEVNSLGFWPGNEAMPEPIFYSYAYPEPAGFSSAKIEPAGASYNPQLKEFVLPYETMRKSPDPDRALLEFAQSAYDAASILGKWDREALVEKKPDLRSAKHNP
jgi:hypothetical protein